MKTATKPAAKETKQAKTAEETKQTTVAAPVGGAVGQVLDFASDAGKGLENADKDSFAIPFLGILQSNSPQCAPTEEGGIEGAKQGMLFNSVTGELMKTAVVIPVAFQRRYLGWAKRNDGGGFKGEFPVLDVDARKIKWDFEQQDGGGTLMVTEDGFVLKDTRMHFILALREDGSFMPALMSLSSTQIKRSKRWLALIQNITMKTADGKPFNPPSFSHKYQIKTVREENAKGAWYSAEISLLGVVEDANLYNAAKAFHAQIVAGKVDIAPPVSDDDGAGGDNGKF